MPTILDSFLTNITSAYIGVVGSHDSGGLNTHVEVTLTKLICALDTTKSSQINGQYHN